MPQTTLAHPEDRALESWDDPARGPIRWRTLLSGDRTDTDTFTCGIAMLSPGDHFVPHQHREPELYFGIAGEVDVEVDGVRHRLRPEAALYSPGDALHGIPEVTEEVRFLYAFAADSFDRVVYRFPGEAA